MAQYRLVCFPQAGQIIDSQLDTRAQKLFILQFHRACHTGYGFFGKYLSKIVCPYWRCLNLAAASALCADKVEPPALEPTLESGHCPHICFVAGTQIASEFVPVFIVSAGTDFVWEDKTDVMCRDLVPARRAAFCALKQFTRVRVSRRLT
jgi:hypothetical protein